MNIMATLQSRLSPGYPGNATTSNVSNPNNSTSIPTSAVSNADAIRQYKRYRRKYAKRRNVI